MASVSPINPQIRALEAPSELRKLQGWLIWRIEHEPGTGNALKVPYWAAGGRRYGKQGGSKDRGQLVTFAAARDAAARRGFDGVGLAMLPDWGITALDFDHVVDADGRMPPEVEDIVSRTYAEYSPSGKGVRAFVRGVLGDHKSHMSQGHAYGYETFSGSGFVTFTGNTLLSTEIFGLEDVIAPVDERVEALCKARFHGREGATSGSDFMDHFEPPLGLSVSDITELLTDLDPSMSRDGWIKVGMALHHEMAGSDEAFDLWDTWSSGGQQYPGDEALRTQWSSFDRRELTQRPVTLGTVKIMSAAARIEQGLPPRAFDTLSRVTEGAKSDLQEADPARSMASGPDYGGKFPIFQGGAFAERPTPPWIIKGVLPKADMGVLFGASGSGKSFVALDWALAVARGVSWRGLKVLQGRVLYLAAEGGGGVSQRLRAYAQHNEVDLSQVPFGVMNSVPNFLVEEDIADVIKALVSAGGADLVIVDTFAQVTAGANENAGEDMGLAIRHARAIREATGAMVLLVHHSGKDASKGARGWSGIRAAADCEFEVVRPEDSTTRLLRITKSKDSRDDLEWGFNLDTVSLGFDDDGDDVTSLVVVEADAPRPPALEPKDAPKRKFGVWERVILDFIDTLGMGVPGLTVNDLIVQAADSVPAPEEGHRDLRRQYVKRALATLAKGADAPVMIEHGQVLFCT